MPSSSPPPPAQGNPFPPLTSSSSTSNSAPFTHRQVPSQSHPSLQPLSHTPSLSGSGSSSPVIIDSPFLYDDPRPDQTLSQPPSYHRQHKGATAAAASTGSSAAASSSRVGGQQSTPAGTSFGDIEMEPIGHRRRTSSLIAPVNQNILRNTRDRSQSTSIHDGPGITEGGESKEVAERDSFSDEDLHDDEETGLTTHDRRRKKRKRRRNTLLDQRIAKERHTVEDEKKEVDKSIVKSLLINAGLIALWYIFSLSISLYNKWMFDEKRLNFAFPLFVTSFHMLVQFALASLVLVFVPSLRPSHAHDPARSRRDGEATNSGMTKMFYLTRIGPCGAATGLDIGLGNTSLKFISLTFYTMCKSSSLAFVLIFAFVFRLEKPTWRLIAIISTMTLGVVLMVFGEVEFRLGGFVLVISAAFFSGFRWGLTQLLLLRNPATSNPISSIYYLTPVMFVALFALAIPVEGFGPLFEGLALLSKEWGAIRTPLFLLFPGCIAFSLTAAEYALLKRTSVVTLSIAGIFKEVLTISVASIVFNDELTAINFVGLLVTLGAIIAYNYLKFSNMRAEAEAKLQERNDYAALTPSSASDGEMNSDEDANEAEEVEEDEGRRLLFDSQTLATSEGDTSTHPASSPTNPHHDKGEH